MAGDQHAFEGLGHRRTTGGAGWQKPLLAAISVGFALVIALFVYVAFTL
jgi:hypothetical protein